MHRRTTLSPAALAAVALVLSISTPSIGRLEAVEPNEYEQYMLEITNRARANPDAEAALHGIDLNEGLPPGTLASGPREPMVFNLTIIEVARTHNDDIIQNMDNLPADHRGSDGRDPTQRVDEAGVVYDFGVGENNAWTSSGSTTPSKGTVDRMHELLFKDFIGPADNPTFEVPGRGHRKNLLDGRWNAVGMGVSGARWENNNNRKVTICTHDFVNDGKLYLTGVAFAEGKKPDFFYSPGEGLGGLTIRATRASDKMVFETTTWGSGGYNLEVEAGTYDVEASGGTLSDPMTVANVEVVDRNVKVDFLAAAAAPPGQEPPPPPTPVFELVKGQAKLNTKKEIWGLKLNKVTYSTGSWDYTGDLSELRVLIDGVEFFGPDDREGAKIKTKANKLTGNTEKIAIKTASKNSLQIDLRKQAIKIGIKSLSMEQFDPSDGVSIQVLFDTTQATLNADAIISGAQQNKALLTPGVGEVGPIDDDAAPL